MSASASLWIKIVATAIAIALGSSGGVYGLASYRLERLERSSETNRRELRSVEGRVADLRTEQRALATRLEGRVELEHARHDELKRRLASIESNLTRLLRRQGMRAIAAP